MADRNTPLELLAMGVGCGLALAGLGWGAAQIIPSLGVAAGLYSATVAAGLAGVAGWVPALGAAATATAAGGVAIIVLHGVFQAAEKKAFAWIAPLIAVITGVLVATAAEYFPTDTSLPGGLGKVLIGAVSALSALAGSLLFRRQALYAKVVGGVLHLGPPGAVLVAILAAGKRTKLPTDLAATPLMVWVLLAVVTGVCGLLMWFAAKADA